MEEPFNERKRVSTGLSTAQIAALKHQLSGSGCVVHEPGSNGYAEATRLWNGTVERKPALVTARSGSAQDGLLPEQPRLLVTELQRAAG